MYIGQIKDCRKALLDQGHKTVDEIAFLSDDEVIADIKDNYVICAVFDDCNTETLILVPISDFCKMVKIER